MAWALIVETSFSSAESAESLFAPSKPWSKTLKSPPSVAPKLLRLTLRGLPMLAASRFITPSLRFSGLDFIGDACSCFAGWSHLSNLMASFRGAIVYAAFSWSSSDDLLRVILGTAFAWLVLSLSARLRGLLGEILRVAGRRVELRFTQCLGLAASDVVSALCVRDRSEGEAGAFGDLGTLGEVMVWRAGLEGERDRDRLISRIEAKPSIEARCRCVGDRRWAALPGECRGEYSNSITARPSGFGERG